VRLQPENHLRRYEARVQNRADGEGAVMRDRPVLVAVPVIVPVIAIAIVIVIVIVPVVRHSVSYRLIEPGTIP
jgi:hypothetical protein